MTMPTIRAALLRAIEEEIATVPLRNLQSRVAEMMSAYRSGDPAAAPLLDETGAKAYAAYRMPGTVAALLRVFAALTETTGAAPTSLVDVGGGTGAGMWAARAVWPSLEQVTVVDRSEAATEVGKRLARELDVPVAWQVQAATDELPSADVAVAAYVFAELEREEAGLVVDAMIEAAPVVVVVEPGTPIGHQRILEVRDRMLDAGLRLAAPCPHHRPCPLAGRDWCHFAARFNRPSWLRRLKGAELGHEDEKFSYVVGTRLDVHDTAPRIIRHPSKREKMITLELCQTDGTAATVTITRRDKAAYRHARDVRWGDRWLVKTS